MPGKPLNLEDFQAGESAVLGHEFFLHAVFDHAALVEDDDFVGVADRAQAVGDDERGAAVDEAVDGFLHELFGDDVEAAGGFVEDDHFGIADEGAGDGEALALAAGEGGAVGDDLGFDAEGKAVDEFADVGGVEDLLEGVFADVVEAVGDVVADGAGEELDLLRDDGEMLAVVAEVEGFHVAAVEVKGAVGGVVEADDQAHKGRFTGAGFADDGNALAGADVEGDVFDGGGCGARILEGDVVEFEFAGDVFDGGALVVFFEVGEFEDFADGAEGFHASGELGVEEGDHGDGADDGGEEGLVHDDVADGHAVAEDEEDGEEEADEGEDIEGNPTAGAEEFVDGVEAGAGEADLLELVPDAQGFFFFEGVGAGDGKHFDHLGDLGGDGLEAGAEFFIAFGHLGAEGAGEHDGEGGGEEEEGEHAELAFGDDDHDGGDNGADAVEAGVVGGAAEGLDDFDVAEDFGLEAATVEADEVGHGKLLEPHQEGGADVELDFAHGFREEIGIQGVEGDVEGEDGHHDGGVEEEVEAQRGAAGHGGVDEVGEDDGHDPDGGLFDGEGDDGDGEAAALAAEENPESLHRMIGMESDGADAVQFVFQRVCHGGMQS